MSAPAFLRLATERMAKRRTIEWATPGDLARYVTPDTIQTPAMDVIDDALLDLYNTPNGRLIISMPPQEGKSTRAAEIFPLWALAQDPRTRIVLVSHSIVLARRNSRHIRDHVKTRSEELDLWVSRTVDSATEWEIAGTGGGIYAIGVGGSLTGRPSDLMIIDDPIKDMQDADSDTIRDNVWDWWITVGSTRQSPGSKVVLIMTRWHEDDIAGRLMEAPDGYRWKYVRIPAQADHDPNHGETDVLGRKPGQYMVSAQGTRDWDAVKLEKTARAWQAMYQGRPSPAGGGMIKTAWWQRYGVPPWTEHPDGTFTCDEPGDEIIQSWDCTFKDTRTSDYVVGQVWLKRGPDAWLLDQVRARLTFTQTMRQMLRVSRKWPQSNVKLIEDKANGTAVLDMLRSQLPGLIAVTPHESKIARVSAVSWSIESGNVRIPSDEIAPWAEEYIEECAGFPTGAHDDQVDATSQALNRLMVNAGAGHAWEEFMRRRTEQKEGVEP